MKTILSREVLSSSAMGIMVTKTDTMSLLTKQTREYKSSR